MRILQDCKIRDIAGDKIVVLKRAGGVDLTRVVMLNKSAELLFEKLHSNDFSMEDVAEVLRTEYGIGKDQSLKDAEDWIKSMKSAGLITE